jgi:hypothetical protein
MTEGEAIERHIEECSRRIERISQFESTSTDCNKEDCEENKFVLKNIIEALKFVHELQARNLTPEMCEEYMKFEDELVKKGHSFNTVLEAVETRTPKRPDIWGDGEWGGEIAYDMFTCPGCGRNYELEDRTNYCPDCGQALLWDGEDFV